MSGISEKIHPDINTLAMSFRMLNIYDEHRSHIESMVSFAKNERKSPAKRNVALQELVRLSGFKAVKINEIFSDEIYLKRFKSIFN